jgi:hypothetical protein
MLVAEMAKVRAIRTIIIGQMPRDDRFTATDGAVLARHRDFLAELGEPMIEGFCKGLPARSASRSTGTDATRPDLEETLRDFWRRLVDGPIDLRFWDWMTLVGLAHVIRRVRKPTMVAAWSWIAAYVSIEAATRLPAQEALKLQIAFGRLGTTLAALATESYLAGYKFAVVEIAALEEGLLQSMVEQVVEPVQFES